MEQNSIEFIDEKFLFWAFVIGSGFVLFLFDLFCAAVHGRAKMLLRAGNPPPKTWQDNVNDPDVVEWRKRAKMFTFYWSLIFGVALSALIWCLKGPAAFNYVTHTANGVLDFLLIASGMIILIFVVVPSVNEVIRIFFTWIAFRLEYQEYCKQNPLEKDNWNDALRGGKKGRKL